MAVSNSSVRSMSFKLIFTNIPGSLCSVCRLREVGLISRSDAVPGGDDQMWTKISMAAIVATFIAGTSAVGYAQGAGGGTGGGSAGTGGTSTGSGLSGGGSTGGGSATGGGSMGGGSMGGGSTGTGSTLGSGSSSTGSTSGTSGVGNGTGTGTTSGFRWRDKPVVNYGAGPYRLGYSPADA